MMGFVMVEASKARFRCIDFRVVGLASAAGLSLAACASAPPLAPVYGYDIGGPRAGADRAQVGPSGRSVGAYKLGAPYEVGGTWYVPAEEPAYDEEGLASWYGNGLNGRPTANGEVFDASMATAAHTTLPMPSIVEVTNLENGRTLRVRLNDRGPFQSGRLIDLSRGAAEQLGFVDKGTARVRVRYVGPARLDHPTEPLYVVRDLPSALPPTPAPASAPMPSGWDVAASTVSDGGFQIQAGAFSDPARAERVAASLAHTGAASVRPVDVGGRRLYRVVVGSWADQAGADRARLQVAALGFADARVIRAF